jgi:hypothetical protein
MYSEFKQTRVLGEQNRKRSLIQPTVTKAAERTRTQELNVKLSFAKVGDHTRDEVRLSISEKGLRFHDKWGDLMGNIKWGDIASVQVGGCISD